MRELQDHTTMIAAASAEIALVVSKKDVQIANTIGLLHHVGVLALGQFNNRQPQYEWLAGVLDQARLGARLLEMWQLPNRVVRAVANGDHPVAFSPDSLDAEARLDVSVLHVAHACVHHLTEHEGEFDGPFLEEYFSILKLPYATCADFAEAIRPKVGLRLPAHLRPQLGPTPASAPMDDRGVPGPVNSQQDKESLTHESHR